MRRCVAQIVAATLAGLPLAYPEMSAADRAQMKELRKLPKKGKR